MPPEYVAALFGLVGALIGAAAGVMGHWVVANRSAASKRLEMAFRLAEFEIETRRAVGEPVHIGFLGEIHSQFRLLGMVENSGFDNVGSVEELERMLLTADPVRKHFTERMMRKLRKLRAAGKV